MPIITILVITLAETTYELIQFYLQNYGKKRLNQHSFKP